MYGSRTARHEYRARAMGSKLHIVATGDAAATAGAVGWAADRIEQLEQRWSRFLPTSDVSRMNAMPGRPVHVSSDTITLVTRALEAQHLSSGRFNPLMLQALHAHGYDRTFVAITTPTGHPPLGELLRGEIRIDAPASTVTVGPGVGFDPGGIGKGLAADMVAEEMVSRGARGALVNLGGDLRCVGEGPAEGTWVISVGDRAAGVDDQILELSEGAVATSTRCRRQWRRRIDAGVVETHHLLDPNTGHVAKDAANLVTVIASRCADAEWLATSIAAEGSLPTNRETIGDAAVMVTGPQGQYCTHGSPERFLR